MPSKLKQKQQIAARRGVYVVNRADEITEDSLGDYARPWGVYAYMEVDLVKGSFSGFFLLYTTNTERQATYVAYERAMFNRMPKPGRKVS